MHDYLAALDRLRRAGKLTTADVAALLTAGPQCACGSPAHGIDEHDTPICADCWARARGLAPIAPDYVTPLPLHERRRA